MHTTQLLALPHSLPLQDPLQFQPFPLLRQKAASLATGLHYKAVPRLRECCRQVEAEVVSNGRSKILEIWEVTGMNKPDQ